MKWVYYNVFSWIEEVMKCKFQKIRTFVNVASLNSKKWNCD